MCFPFFYGEVTLREISDACCNSSNLDLYVARNFDVPLKQNTGVAERSCCLALSGLYCFSNLG
jgi:hypothetical protein